MNPRLSIVFTALLFAAIVVGCATSEIIPIGSDSYMISQTSAGGVFRSMSSLKTGVIKRANAFAESQGKIAVPIAAKESPSYPGHMPNFEYQFRVVDKNEPSASGAALIPRADLVIENKTAITSDGSVKDQPEPKDVYSELLKLDDLRKKDIINEAEFELLKNKLLSGK